MKSFVSIIALICFTQTLQAEALFECGGNAGYSYYFEGDFVPKKDSGQTEDGTSQGSYSLINKGEDLDLIFTDATGRVISAVADGGQVFMLGQGNSTVLVLVNYPNMTAETYLFNLKTGQYSLNQVKYGNNPIHKSTNLVGECY